MTDTAELVEALLALAADEKDGAAKWHMAQAAERLSTLSRERDQENAAADMIAEVREAWKSRALAAEALLKEAGEALEPFAGLMARPCDLNDPRLADDTVLEVGLFNVESRRRRAASGFRIGHYRRAADLHARISAVGEGTPD